MHSHENLVMIGERIRNARRRAKLSQTALGKLSGYSMNGIAKIERGESDPKTTTLFRIANALFIEVSDLVSLIPIFPLQSGSLEENQYRRARGREIQQMVKSKFDDQFAAGLSLDEAMDAIGPKKAR